MAIKQFVVKVKECERKEDKQKFNAYKAITKDGTLIDLKFRKEVPAEDKPTVNSVIGVDIQHMNMEKNTQYPAVWVEKVEYHFPLESDKTVFNDMFDDANYEDTTGEDNVAEDNVAEDTSVEDNVAEDNVAEDTSVEDNVAEDNQIKDTPAQDELPY